MQAAADRVPDKDCAYSTLLERMFRAQLNDNRDRYESVSAVIRQKFRKNDKQLMPDLLGLLRDHYGAKEHKVGAIDLSKGHITGIHASRVLAAWWCDPLVRWLHGRENQHSLGSCKSRYSRHWLPRSRVFRPAGEGAVCSGRCWSAKVQSRV